MGIDDIKALPVGDLAAKDAHLFLCTTGPCLRMAFDVIEAWGFRYSSVAFTWIKLKRSIDPMQLRILPTAEMDLHVGLGLTTRKNAESFCWGAVATRDASPRMYARSSCRRFGSTAANRTKFSIGSSGIVPAHSSNCLLASPVRAGPDGVTRPTSSMR